MRILVLSYEYPPLGGGGGVAVAHFARAWTQLGHDVTVVTSGVPSLAAHEQETRLHVHRVAVPMRDARATATVCSLVAFAPLALSFVRRTWTRNDFDIVVSAFAIPSGVAGMVLARAWRLPHVVIVMGGDVYDPSKWLSPHRMPGLKQTVGFVLKTATTVVAISNDLAQRAKQVYRLQCSPRVISLGLNLPEFIYTPHDKTTPHIVCVARLVRRKYLNQLIEAFAALSSTRARLTLVGDGPERAALEQLIEKLGVQDRVDLVGYVSEEEKFAILRSADIFALVSEHEGFGLVYLEAASQGLPIVAGTVGGQIDFLEDGRTGSLVQPGDVERLTAALTDLVEQPELRRTMGAAALAVAARYHVQHVAEAYLAMLQTTCDQQRVIVPVRDECETVIAS